MAEAGVALPAAVAAGVAAPEEAAVSADLEAVPLEEADQAEAGKLYHT